jgi:hypothetical protein
MDARKLAKQMREIENKNHYEHTFVGNLPTLVPPNFWTTQPRPEALLYVELPMVELFGDWILVDGGCLLLSSPRRKNPLSTSGFGSS